MPTLTQHPVVVQLKESQQREQALSADLEAAKKAQQEAQQQLQQAQTQVQAIRDAPMLTPSPTHRSMENGMARSACAMSVCCCTSLPCAKRCLSRGSCSDSTLVGCLVNCVPG